MVIAIIDKKFKKKYQNTCLNAKITLSLDQAIFIFYKLHLPGLPVLVRDIKDCFFYI